MITHFFVREELNILLSYMDYLIVEVSEENTKESFIDLFNYVLKNYGYDKDKKLFFINLDEEKVQTLLYMYQICLPLLQSVTDFTEYIQERG